MKYIKIINTAAGTETYASGTEATASYYQNNTPDTVQVTVSDVPFLPQAIIIAVEKARDWAVVQGLAVPNASIEKLAKYGDVLRNIRAAKSLAEINAGLAPLLEPTTDNLTIPIRVECERRVNAALRSATVQASMDRRHAVINGMLAAGTVLPTGYQEDKDMFIKIDQWESDMVDRREAMILSGDPDYLLDSKWVPTPAGLDTFLNGY